MKKTIFLIILFLLGVLRSELYGALQMELFKYDSLMNITIDISTYPLFKAKLRVKQDGIYVPIQKENLSIVEDCWTSKPRTVLAPDSDNWQEVSWPTRIKGPFQRADFMVVLNNESIIRTGIDRLDNMSQIRMTNSTDHDEPDMFFGSIPIGKDTTRGIIVNAPMAVVIDGQEQPIRVDSVKTHSPNFSYDWRGSSISTKLPPVDMISPFYYRVKLNFKPTENKFYRDKFSVYYEGGKVEEINLIGNNYVMKRNTVLNVIEPNGGEILQPCQKYTIKWKGHVPGIPTTISFSTDAGGSWNQIGQTMDSTFVWKIPNEPTNNALVKVKQDFQNTTEMTLKVNNSPIRKVAYRSDGFSALAANDEGNIYQWDLVTFQVKKIYNLNEGTASQITRPFGLEFFDSDSMIVAGFYKQNQFNGKRVDSLAYFKAGTSLPVSIVPIEAGYYPKKMFIDSKREKLALIPVFGNRLMILSAKDGSIIQNVYMPYPISSFAFNSKSQEAAICLVTGEIKILSTTDFSEIRSLDFSALPLITEIGLSANGELLSLGCKAPTPNIIVGNNTEIHVADIASGTIFRTIRNTSSDPIGLEFNPSSNVLVVGSKAQPQIALWDLPSNEFIGSMAGNDNVLTDFRFSPEGHSILTAASSSQNLVIRFFTYPEQDSSDNTFRIVAPIISAQKFVIEPKYLATSTDIKEVSQFCNKGIVPLGIDDAWMVHGIHYKLTSDFKGDTLYPNECLPISIVYNPLDTGRITDSIAISTCIGLFYLPIESYSMKRNISFLQKVFNFGELCVGSTIEREIELARNDDPVPLKVNIVTFDNPSKNPFTVVKNVVDEIIPPGGTIKITVRFAPKDLGLIFRNFVIKHSDQQKMVELGPVEGNGIGSFLQLSHADLRFIPEIPDRIVKVKNLTPNEIRINKFIFSTEGIFSVTNPLPVVIPLNGETEFNIKWNGTLTQDVKLSFDAEPCLLQSEILIGVFSGTSNVSIPIVQADPKGTAVIPVTFINTSHRLYNGTRVFSADFSINPRMFLPEEVTTKFGTAELTRNEIVNDKRIIGIKVEGDFPETGTIAEIKGIAGLAETDISPIELDKNSLFWSKTVTVSTTDGIFKLINLCGDRQILQNKPVLIANISPNPAGEEFRISYFLENSTETSFEMYDNLGVLIKSAVSIPSINGMNNIEVDSANLLTGTYKVIIRQSTAFDVQTILIVK